MIFKVNRFYTHPRMLDCMVWVRMCASSSHDSNYTLTVKWVTKTGMYLANDQFNLTEKQMGEWIDVTEDPKPSPNA